MTSKELNIINNRAKTIEEMKKRGIGDAMSGHTIIYSRYHGWTLMPSWVNPNPFEGSLNEALSSDLVCNELKNFIIHNMDLFI